VAADLASISSIERSWRVSSRPDGSPMRVVPPPISVNGLPAPVACIQCRIMIDRRWPMCRDGAVQS
jgi:hypothetical protein